MANVEVENIGKSFAGRSVLSNLDLTIGDGELICLLGPSGCGKTTLLRIIAGFIAPDAGRVRVGGTDVTDVSASARRMGMVFQAYSLFPNMTALENVRFGPRVAGVPKLEQVTRARTLLDLVGLSEHENKYAHQLSGGQQQRVALARALAVQPQVLLLDEPLSALDAKVRIQLREEIQRIQRETGVTTVLVTHDQEEALSIADRVAVMHQGRLLQVARPAVIYREPADGFVARFIGSGAVLPSVNDAGQPVDLFLRPEHVRLAPLAAVPPPGAVIAELRGTLFLGAQTRMHLTLPDGASLWADLPSEQAEAFALGTKVIASWDASAARVLARQA